MSTVFDYVVEMQRCVDEIRAFAATTTADMPEDLAYAVILAVPFARWGRIGLGDDRLDLKMRLDLIAAHEYAGAHGYDWEYVDDWAEKIAFDALEEIHSSRP
jgi:hypothetical protein